MHKDEVKGVGKQAKGAIKDAVGGLTGNEKLQAEGKFDKAAGKVQQKAGEAKDAVRDALKR
ncbi:CsbD family protein [Devosia sp.]|uniref:CsbD family protein n=1 Tax=Devosia sp. TaxID=1871048 RepID=UPI002FC5AAE8